MVAFNTAARAHSIGGLNLLLRNRLECARVRQRDRYDHDQRRRIDVAAVSGTTQATTDAVTSAHARTPARRARMRRHQLGDPLATRSACATCAKGSRESQRGGALGKRYDEALSSGGSDEDSSATFGTDGTTGGRAASIFFVCNMPFAALQHVALGCSTVYST